MPWPARRRRRREHRRPRPLAADRRRDAAGGDHHRLARAAAAGARRAPRPPPHRLREPAGGGGRHRHRHAPRAGDPGRTAALVTADRALARRVAAELRRWRDRGGRFGRRAAGRDGARRSFLRLTARMIAEDAAPVPLLAALKHPLAAGGDRRRRRGAARCEPWREAILRGPRPAPGSSGLRAALKEDDRRPSARWLEGLEAAAVPFAALMAQPERRRSRKLLQAHVEFRGMARGHQRRRSRCNARLWSGEAGEQAARFVAGLLEAASALPPVAPPSTIPALLDALMEDHVVRPPFGRHPACKSGVLWRPGCSTPTA